MRYEFSVFGLSMPKHVYYQENDTGLEVVRCCSLDESNSIHVPAQLGELLHGDRVYKRQCVTAEALNSLLERLDRLEDDVAPYRRIG